jgi:hypothetical protein
MTTQEFLRSAHPIDPAMRAEIMDEPARHRSRSTTSPCSSPANPAAAAGALPRPTATTTCASSTSTACRGTSRCMPRRDVIEAADQRRPRHQRLGPAQGAGPDARVEPDAARVAALAHRVPRRRARDAALSRAVGGRVLERARLASLRLDGEEELSRAPAGRRGALQEVPLRAAPAAGRALDPFAARRAADALCRTGAEARSTPCAMSR